MPPRYLWIAVPIALAVWHGSALAAGDVPVLRPGETVRLEMPKGAPEKTSVTIELETPDAGPLTIEARSLDFDTGLAVSCVGADGELTPVGEDDDGGIGTNSRLGVEAVAGGRHRIDVHPVGEDWGGEFELSIVPGKAASFEAGTKADADLVYWQDVESRARGKGSVLLEARALDGRATALQADSYAEKRALYERALEIRERVLGPEHPDTAETLDSLASLLKEHGGESVAARPLYERLLAICEKVHGPEHRETADGLTNLGDTLRDMGDYASARPLYERALAIRERVFGPEHPETADGLTNLAVLFWAMGDYASARPLYERTLAIYERVYGPDHPYTAGVLTNLAWCVRAMGEYAAARPLYERALAIHEKMHGPGHPETADGLTSMAYLFKGMGEYAAARPLFEQALAMREKESGPEHWSTGMALYDLVLLLQATGEYAAARPLLDRAIAIVEKVLGPDHPLVARMLSDSSALLAVLGERAEALDQALEAERIGREHLQVTHRSLSEREALRYAAELGSGLDPALTLAAGGLEPDQRRRALDALVRSRGLVLDEMAARHRATGDSADPEVAQLAEYLASRRARLASLIVRGPSEQKPESYRKFVDDARKEKEEAERALAGSSAAFARELSRGRQGLDEVAASLPEGSVLVAFSQYQRIDFTPRRPAAVDPDKDAARGGTTVPSYLAFVLRAGARDPEVVDLGRAAGIDEAVARWKKEASRGVLLAGATARAEADYRAAGATLRRKVWDPLTAALGDAARVFVVPDGSLNLVSVAALPVDGGGYLIEHGPLLHYVSAERNLVPAGEERRGTGLLALGGPSYDATQVFAALRKRKGEEVAKAATSDAPILLASAAMYRGQRSTCNDFATVRFGPLPATAKETREIVRLWEKHGKGDENQPSVTGGEWKPAEVLDLREAAASETALKREAAGRRVLHLATHGFFLGGGCESALDATRGIGGLAEVSGARQAAIPPPVTGENPLVLSGLALAGANHRAAAGEGEDDGILTAEEIASLDLSGVEWAVLSACETGVGNVRAGEGVFGLRRAFQVAGVGTLIMSLWSVDDEATRSWMKELYEGRLAKGLDTAEAVRQAGLAVLNQRRKAGLSTHPFYWAAFVAAGDWR